MRNRSPRGTRSTRYISFVTKSGLGCLPPFVVMAGDFRSRSATRRPVTTFTLTDPRVVEAWLAGKEPHNPRVIEGRHRVRRNRRRDA